MSNDTDDIPEPKFSPQKHAYTPKPKQEDGTLDKEAIRAQYMASKMIGFPAFCREKGYDPVQLMHYCPHKDWKREKQREMAERSIEEINDKIWDVKTKFPAKIAAAISESADLAALCRSVVGAKLKQVYDRQKDEVGFTKKQDVYELVSLVNAANQAIDMSKKATFTDGMKLKIAEEMVPQVLSDMNQQQELDTSVVVSDGMWRIKLIGVDNPMGMTAAQIDRMLEESNASSRSEDDAQAAPSSDE